jgi:hypothetical protein
MNFDKVKEGDFLINKTEDHYYYIIDKNNLQLTCLDRLYTSDNYFDFKTITKDKWNMEIYIWNNTELLTSIFDNVLPNDETKTLIKLLFTNNIF